MPLSKSQRLKPPRIQATNGAAKTAPHKHFKCSHRFWISFLAGSTRRGHSAGLPVAALLWRACGASATRSPQPDGDSI